MLRRPSHAECPACVSLIREFLEQHLDALCSALAAAGAAEIAQLLRMCTDGLLSREQLAAYASDEEQPPQVAFIRQRCWLELHHGVYRNVAVVWRDVYLATSLILAARAASAAAASAPMLQQALKAIDGALLFGAILGRSIAEDVYEELSQLLHRADTPASDTVKRQKMCCNDSGASAPPPLPCVFNVRLTEQQLPPLTHPMPRLQPPSLLQFRSCYLQPLLPVVLESLAEHWPATTRWCDLEYLEAAAGTRTVPVELGDHYLAHNWRQQLMPISQFIKEHICSAADSDGLASPAPPCAAKLTGYVAQHDLFSQVKKLRADIVVPDYVCTTAHSDAVAGVCPAAATALLAHVCSHSPYHRYHCCSDMLHPPHARSSADNTCHNEVNGDDDPALLPSSPPPAPSDIKPKVLRECVSPTPPDTDTADGDECSVRMHAWFGPAGCARKH